MDAFWQTLFTSIEISAWSTLFTAVIGLPIARFLAEGGSRSGPWRAAIDVAVMLPLVLPPSVLGYYLLILLGPTGPVGLLAASLTGRPLLFTIPAAVVASVAVSLPLFVQAVRNAFEGVPGHLPEAAAVDGAARRQIFLFIQAPLSWPGIVTGLVLALARSLGEFGATLMVAGNIPGRTQTMSLAIYSAVQVGRYDRAHVLSAALVGVAAIAIWLMLRLGRRGRDRFPE